LTAAKRQCSAVGRWAAVVACESSVGCACAV
jgi:hypothetical protein